MALQCSRQAVFWGGRPGIAVSLSLSSQEVESVMAELVAMSTDRYSFSPREAMHPGCFGLPSTESKGSTGTGKSRESEIEPSPKPRENAL